MKEKKVNCKNEMDKVNYAFPKSYSISFTSPHLTCPLRALLRISRGFNKSRLPAVYRRL